MAIAPVVIDVLVRGTPAVAQSFRGVQNAAERAQRAMERDAERGEKKRVASAQREAREKVRLIQKSDADNKRIADRAYRDTERAERAAVAAKAKGLREQERLVERHAREQVRIHQQARREVERIEERSRARVSRDEDRRAAKWVRDSERDARRGAAHRERFATSAMGAGARGVVAGLQRTAAISTGLATTAASLGGGFSIAGAVGERGNLNRAAVQLSNSAFIPGQNKRPETGAIVNRAKAASVATGIDATDIVEATKAYVARASDFDGGMANMQFFGEIAKGTGADINDVARAAGTLRVQNKKLDGASMKQMLLDIVMQGKQGSVEFEDLATAAGKVTRTSANYAGSQTGNQRRLLGLSQIGMRTSGSVEEAATVLANLSQDALKHKDDVGAVLGSDFLNAKGQIAKAPEEFLADVMEKTGGNMGKITDMKFGARSMKMFQALAPTFNDAEAQARASGASDADARRAGRQAILAEMHQVTDASYSEKDLGDDLKAINDSAPEQFATAMRELKMAVGDELLPEFLKLVPVIRESTPAFVGLLKTSVPAFIDVIKALSDFATANRGIIQDLAAHPIGTLIGFEITKSFTTAALPQLLQSLMRGAFGGAGGGVVGGGVPGSQAGPGGGVLAGVALQAAQFFSIYKDVTNSRSSGQAAGADIATRLAKGDPAAADELAKAQEQAGHGGAAALDLASRVMAGITGPVGMAASYASDAALSGMGYQTEDDRAKQTLRAQQIVDVVELQRITTEAIGNGVKNGMNNSGSSGAGRHETIINR